jgi:hypothetical protein
MIVRLQRLDNEAAKESLIARSCKEPSAVAEPAIGDRPARPDLAGRKLRNRLLLANAAAWIVIIAAIRLIFF